MNTAHRQLHLLRKLNTLQRQVLDVDPKAPIDRDAKNIRKTYDHLKFAVLDLVEALEASK